MADGVRIGEHVKGKMVRGSIVPSKDAQQKEKEDVKEESGNRPKDERVP